MLPGMKRGAVTLAGFAILVAAFAWVTVGQDREFRRLIAAGDVALSDARIDEAIEKDRKSTRLNSSH